MAQPAAGMPQCTQGEPLVCGCYPAAYNLPAVYAVNDKGCWSWLNAFVDASFTYWYAGEEGLPLAENGVLSTTTLFFPQNITTVFQSFNYKPGFKVALGIVGNHEWSIFADYTWFRGNNTSNSGAPPSLEITTAGATTLTGTPVWVVDDWFLQGSGSQALAGTNVTSKWRLAMDLVDLSGSRPFYEGPNLTINPYGGLRAAFIRQKMTVGLTQSTGYLTGAVPFIQSRNSSHSWAIGPRMGVNSNWLCCGGFRFEGDFAASLLYTRYTSVKHSEDSASTDFNPGSFTASYRNYGCLRPITEVGLGIGWGSYFWCCDYHIDFSADYEFAYYWDQNMMRKLLDDTLTGTSPAAADLYTHGLTLTARLDF